MKLYLVQHGEACAKDVNPERPLTEKGRVDVERIAQFLQRAGINVDSVIHSGKLRAAQTADIMISILAPGTAPVTSKSISPNDDPAAFDWQKEGCKGDILVVGHLPFIAKLVSHLLINDTERVFAAYQPGSIVCLELAENSSWQLNWMMRPNLLTQ